MSRLQKNIQQVVAKKALKDIGKIVQAEDKKEKLERYWAKILAGIIFLVAVVLMLLKRY